MRNKPKFFILATLFILIFSRHALGVPVSEIKVALLDDIPIAEMPVTALLSEYENAYFSGVETAAYVAQKYGYKITYKPFIFGKGPLDIFDEIPKIKKWKANIVLGPASSDRCLLLRGRLTNTLTLSSYASDVNLQKLLKNFYSTMLPDDRIMDMLTRYIHIKFPTKNIYIIEQIDCKQCVDVSQLFIDSYKNISPSTKIFENKIIMDDINSIDSKKLLEGHKKDAILIFNDSYYAYNALVQHLAQAFPNERLTFFSDQDNWGHEADGRKYKLDLNYNSYRITPILMDKNSLSFKEFSQIYYKIYQQPPTNATTYLTYNTLMSVIEALNQFPDPTPNDSMRKKILYSYKNALKKNPNWFRAKSFGIYQLTSQGEVLVDRLATTS